MRLHWCVLYCGQVGRGEVTGYKSQAFSRRTITREQPVAGIDMWVAVWSNRGRGEVVLGAPTLDQLAARWEQITNCDFDRTIAQRTIQVAWHGKDVPKPPESEDTSTSEVTK